MDNLFDCNNIPESFNKLIPTSGFNIQESLDKLIKTSEFNIQESLDKLINTGEFNIQESLDKLIKTNEFNIQESLDKLINTGEFNIQESLDNNISKIETDLKKIISDTKTNNEYVLSNIYNYLQENIAIKPNFNIDDLISLTINILLGITDLISNNNDTYPTLENIFLNINDKNVFNRIIDNLLNFKNDLFFGFKEMLLIEKKNDYVRLKVIILLGFIDIIIREINGSSLLSIIK